ncbi:helix-turn-helix domain-containing protein [Streptomyces sp. NRRL F-5135]|uniref:helix-turn-helix domain-containing protein n=1 Tax=Streptomyces sp. NRRL F-5135 TaxID=1463858 RepID=UPI00099CC857|nr:helix-turn-helix transcriptional regulator [Streptomyces sp. NRRL F-5135]
MEPPATTYQVDGAEIRARRMELGLSQAECAARARIARPYLSQIETGARQHLRPPTYKALRAALALTPDDRRLLDPDEDPARKESNGIPHQAEAGP